MTQIKQNDQSDCSRLSGLFQAMSNNCGISTISCQTISIYEFAEHFKEFLATKPTMFVSTLFAQRKLVSKDANRLTVLPVFTVYN